MAAPQVEEGRGDRTLLPEVQGRLLQEEIRLPKKNSHEGGAEQKAPRQLNRLVCPPGAEPGAI
jgi:hypothetical protein